MTKTTKEQEKDLGAQSATAVEAAGCQPDGQLPHAAGRSNVPFTPDDAFGLLRSYSRHRDYVRLALTIVQQAVERRAIEHDASKMLDDEFAGFARINAVARVNKFGTPEYKASINAERPTVDLHFIRNSHHPERPKLIGEAAEALRGLPDDFTYWTARDGAEMTFLDVIEMVCDWWGARLGYADSRMTWPESVEMNLSSKGKYLKHWQIALVRDVAHFLALAEPQKAGTATPVSPSVIGSVPSAAPKSNSEGER